MDRKKQLEAIEPSSSEEESGVDSSDEEDDEFDSEDERVKQVPLHPPADFFTQEDEEAGSSSSDDSDTDSESVENTNKNTKVQESEVGDYVTSSDDDDDEDDDDDDDDDSGESENESEETQEFNTATVNTKSPTQKATGGRLDKDGSTNLHNNSISVEMKGKVEDQHSVRKTAKTEALKLQNNEKEVDKSNRNGNGNVNKKEQEFKNVKPGNEEQGNRSSIKNGKSVNNSNEDQGNRSTMKNGKSANSSGTNEEQQAYKLALVTKDSQQKLEQRNTQIQKKEKEVKSSNIDDKDTKANNGELGKRTREEQPSDSEATTNTAAARMTKKKKKEHSSTVESLAKDDVVAVMQKKQQSVVDESSDRETSTKKRKNKKEQSGATMDVEQSLQNGDMKSAHNEKTVKQDLKKGDAKKLLRTESTVTGNGSAVVVERKASVSKQESEVKQKRPHVWKFDEEAYFLQLILDHVNPGTESEENWLMILEKLSEYRSILSEKMHSKFGIELVKEQMYDKLRRMKKKFQSNGNKPFQCKNSNDQVLYDLWNQLLGNHKASDPKGQGEPVGDQSLKSNVKGGQNFKDSKKKQVSKANKSNSVKAKDRDNGDFTDDPEISKNEMDVDRNEKASDMEIDKNRTSMDVDNGNSVVGSDRMNALVECNGHVKANMNKNMCPESFYISSSVLDVVQTEREAFICEHKEWLRQTLDGLTSKITSHVDNLKNQNQTIQVNNSGSGLTMSSLAGLDIRNVMDFQPSQHCDPSTKREWYELQMQELNIHSQRLKLMLSECELQKEKLKLQLQLDRRQG